MRQVQHLNNAAAVIGRHGMKTIHKTIAGDRRLREIATGSPATLDDLAALAFLSAAIQRYGGDRTPQIMKAIRGFHNIPLKQRDRVSFGGMWSRLARIMESFGEVSYA